MSENKLHEEVTSFIYDKSLEELSSLKQYEIAEHFGISEGFLSKEFKKGTKYFLSEFICMVKLIKVEKRLITRTDLTVEQLSVMFGIKNISQFRKIFKKFFLLNPGHYKTINKYH